MAYLWCNDCGTKKEEKFKVSTKHDGESVYIASGILVSGEYRCDDCNNPMATKDKAVFCAFLCAGQTCDTSRFVPYFGLGTVNENTYG
jgi:hypothetical protein